MRHIMLVGGASAALALAVIFGAWGWLSAGDTEIGVHGWVALVLGVTLTIGVGVGLMALVFYSSRYGYDEAAHFEDEDLRP